MRMYVKVMAAVIACILLSGETLSAFATTAAITFTYNIIEFLTFNYN